MTIKMNPRVSDPGEFARATGATGAPVNEDEFTGLLEPEDLEAEWLQMSLPRRIWLSVAAVGRGLRLVFIALWALLAIATAALFALGFLAVVFLDGGGALIGLATMFLIALFPVSLVGAALLGIDTNEQWVSKRRRVYLAR